MVSVEKHTHREMRCYRTEDIRWGEWTGRGINSPLEKKKGNLKSRWCKEEIEKRNKKGDRCMFDIRCPLEVLSQRFIRVFSHFRTHFKLTESAKGHLG